MVSRMLFPSCPKCRVLTLDDQDYSARVISTRDVVNVLSASVALKCATCKEKTPRKKKKKKKKKRATIVRKCEYFPHDMFVAEGSNVTMCPNHLACLIVENKMKMFRLETLEAEDLAEFEEDFGEKPVKIMTYDGGESFAYAPFGKAWEDGNAESASV